MRWALVYVVGLYIRGGGLYSGGLIVGGLRYGNFFDHCNIFVNRWSEFLLISIKISKIRKKAEHTFETDIFSCVVWKFEKNLLKPAEEQLVWKSEIAVKWGKIEFEYYIFNVFLIAAKCILLNNSVSFQHFLFKLGQIVETSLMLSWKPIKKFQEKLTLKGVL
jgi:hypothetical protein